MTEIAQGYRMASKLGSARHWLSTAGAICFLLLTWPGQAADTPTVVVSIKPLHALVAGVMRGVAVPKLLMTGATSPHDYALKPSDADALEKAQRVFWMGPALEGFLAGPLGTLAPAVSVPLGERLGARIRLSRVETLPISSEAADHHHAEHGEPDDFANDHREADDRNDHARADIGHTHLDDQGHRFPDLHAWLDPTIAAAIVDIIASELESADPEHIATYQHNAADLRQRLATLDHDLAATLDPAKDRPFVVFHDAYQYFEARYALSHRGTLSLSPGMPPGARRLAAIRAEILGGNVDCVFAEPQFDPKLVSALTDGGAARTASLDPLGVDLEPGPDAYFILMRRMAAILRQCLVTN